MDFWSRYTDAFVLAALVGGIVATTSWAATSVKSGRDNVSLTTAQPVTLAPDLVLRQKSPNDTLATAQSVSPKYYAFDVFGSLTQHQPAAFFTVALVAGNHLHVEVEAKKPTAQFTELLLYDQNKNLVAIANGNAADASGSVIDFTIPFDGAGTWSIEVTSSPGHPEAKASHFKYDLRMQTLEMVYQTDVHGRFTKKSGFYGISAVDGDQLHIAVEAKDPTKGFPELLLYDQKGNLVAIANGNASNGSGSVIDFTIPSGATGTWTAEVTGSPSVDPAKNHFPYDLEIEGSTGLGPVVPR